MWVSVNNHQRHISENQNAYLASTGIDKKYVLILLGYEDIQTYSVELILNGVSYPLTDKDKYKICRTDHVHFNISKIDTENLIEKFPETEFLASLNRDYDVDTYKNMNGLEKGLLRKAYYFGKSRS